MPSVLGCQKTSMNTSWKHKNTLHRSEHCRSVCILNWNYILPSTLRILWIGSNQWSNQPGQNSLTKIGLFGWSCNNKSMFSIESSLKFAVIRTVVDRRGKFSRYSECNLFSPAHFSPHPRSPISIGDWTFNAKKINFPSTFHFQSFCPRNPRLKSVMTYALVKNNSLKEKMHCLAFWFLKFATS